MGNANYRQVATNQQQDMRNIFQTDLPKFIIQSKKGDGKFMKTYVMKLNSTPVIVKVHLRLMDEDLNQIIYKLTYLFRTISPTKYPNLMPFQMWMRSNQTLRANKLTLSPVYLVRQYFGMNLRDRLSTRPFFNDLEKLWIVFQLCNCIDICHSLDVVHGDIRPENIMVTADNWVILTDFSSPFKPVKVPDDDPSDFQYFFGAMGRQSCYLAPERFETSSKLQTTQKTEQGNASTTSWSGSKMFSFRKQKSTISNTSSTHDNEPLLPSMDIFSLGCVIAEMFADGAPLFDLPAMHQYLSSDEPAIANTASLASTIDSFYREDDNSAMKSILQRIKSTMIRDLVIDMTQKNPTKRLTIKDYLSILLQGGGKSPTSNGQQPMGFQDRESLNEPIFPLYFSNFLHPLYYKLHWGGTTPDERIMIICKVRKYYLINKS